MVFGGDFDGRNNNNGDNNGDDAAARIQAMRAANCIRILGKGVIRVVHRVDDARENNNLGNTYERENENFSFLFVFPSFPVRRNLSRKCQRSKFSVEIFFEAEIQIFKMKIYKQMQMNFMFILMRIK